MMMAKVLPLKARTNQHHSSVKDLASELSFLQHLSLPHVLRINHPA
jgi:hypothetical protein